MVLEVLAGAGQVHHAADAVTAQQITIPDTRELEQLGPPQGANRVDHSLASDHGLRLGVVAVLEPGRLWRRGTVRKEDLFHARVSDDVQVFAAFDGPVVCSGRIAPIPPVGVDARKVAEGPN